MERLEEIKEYKSNYDLENPHFIRDRHIGDGIFVIGSSVGLSGYLTDLYTLALWRSDSNNGCGI